MTDLAALATRNAVRFDAAKLTRDFSTVARRLVEPKAKARYQAVQAATGVPWFIIAVIHEREASQRWDTQLGQGDPLGAVSVHVPAGRGPFKTWEEGAIDALVNCAPYAARNKDWSVGAALTKLEEYNGLGYASRGLPSPYIWSGTDQYRSGKYVRDGVFDPNVVDSQLGCAGLLKAMMALDPSIVFGAAAPQPAPSRVVPPSSPKPASKPVPPPAKPTKPTITNPSKGSIGAFIAELIRLIFRRS